MKCPACGAAEMVSETRDVPFGRNDDHPGRDG